MPDFKKLTYTVAAAVLAMGVSTSAHAASMLCADAIPDVTELLTVNAGCEVLTSADNDSNTTVDGMFGVADWTQMGKVDFPDEVAEDTPFSDGALSLVGDRSSGTWAILQGIFDTYESVMIVIKGGDKALPEAVVGYLVEVPSGEYYSPFFDAIKNSDPVEYKNKAISHISLYVGPQKDCDIINEFCGPPANNPVPLPAGLPLLLTALGGVGIISRTRAKKA